MPRRETLEQFDIYREVVNLRLRARATSAGRERYTAVSRWLGGHSLIDADTRESVAKAEASAEEKKFLAQWKDGRHRDDRSEGIGLRALLKPWMKDILVARFVPEPQELGAPEVVDIVRTEDEAVIFAGLILPHGSFVFDQLPYDDRPRLYLYANYTYSPPDPDRLDRRGYLNPWNHDVISISDPAGAYWEPPVNRAY